jgi:hypothetical protein
MQIEKRDRLIAREKEMRVDGAMQRFIGEPEQSSLL